MSRRLIRDDIKGGGFLNKKIIYSPTDYRRAKCYYWGDPVQFCIAYYDYGKIHSPDGSGYQAELALAAEGFHFDKRLIHEGLAIFFRNGKFKNIRLQALISPGNRQAIRLAKLSGFTEEGRLREVSPDGDRLVYSMLKREFDSLYGRNILKTKSANAAKSRGAGKGATGFTVHTIRKPSIRDSRA